MLQVDKASDAKREYCDDTLNFIEILIHICMRYLKFLLLKNFCP